MSGRERGSCLLRRRGFDQRSDGPPDDRRPVNQLHVVPHRAILAGHQLDRVGDRRRIALFEPCDQWVIRNGRGGFLLCSGESKGSAQRENGGDDERNSAAAETILHSHTLSKLVRYRGRAWPREYAHFLSQT